MFTEHLSQNENNCVQIINQEIIGSLETIHQAKKILVNFITLYVSAVFGFFYYGAYIEGKIALVSKKNDLPNKEYFIFGLIGVFLVLIIFLFGWALLGLVTRTICTTIKQYKHISYMRNISSKLFPPGMFEMNCLNPIASRSYTKGPKLPIRIAESLPYLFCLVNFMFLLSSIYFLKLFLTIEVAISFYLFVSGVFALFYTNLITKHIAELRIVQQISPTNDEVEVREKFAEELVQHKNERKFSITYRFLWVLSLFYFLSFSWNIYFDMKNSSIPNWLLYIQLVVMILIAILSIFLSLFKVETKLTFKKYSAL